MQLYFQILTQDQTRQGLQLLRFASGLFEAPVSGKAKLLSGGLIRNISFKSMDTLLHKLSKTQFNEIEVGYRPPFRQSSALPFEILSFTALLTASPSCEFWFSTNNWPTIIDRSVRNRKSNAQAQEATLKNFDIGYKPVVIEIVIDIKSTISNEQLLSEFACWLTTCMPREIVDLGVSGCVDAGDGKFMVKLDSHILMLDEVRIMSKLLPPLYHKLGTHFDALHPILFGLKSVCKGMKAELVNNARLFESRSFENFAALYVNENFLAQGQKNIISKYLLPSYEAALADYKSKQKTASKT